MSLTLEWLSVAFILAVAIVAFIWRRSLAAFEAIAAGGSVRPGCVAAQAAVLFAIGVAIALLIAAGFFG